MKSSFIVVLLSFLVSYQGLAQDCPPGPLLDQAYIRFVYNKTIPTTGPTGLTVNYTLSQCFDCLTQFAANVSYANPNMTYFVFTTVWPATFYIYNEEDWGTPNHDVPPPIITYSFDIQQNGNYTFYIYDMYDQTTQEFAGLYVNTTVDVAGDDIWIPVYIMIGVFIGLALLYNLLIFGVAAYKKRKVEDQRASLLEESRAEMKLNTSGDTSRNTFDSVTKPVAPKGKDMSQRVQSLDTFRGLTLATMIFVNAGGGLYALFDHAPWNGLQLPDLLFPWFIWMMGFSMAISFESQKKKGATKRDMLEKVLMRTFKLTLISMMMKFGKPLNLLRIPGILLRFAIAYFFVSLIIILVPRNENSKYLEQGDKYKVLVLHIYEYIVCFAIILLWLGFTFLLPVPGCPTGYIGPGGLLGSFGLYPNCTGGAARYIDIQILGINHMFQTPTCQPIYLTGPYDPEGLLGNLTSIAMVFFGLTAGRVMVYHKGHKDRLVRWLIGAVFFGIISMILTGCSQNGGWIPVNKNIWSLSFITVQCCFGLLSLSFWYVIVDIKKWWGGGPFRAMGMNSITMFTGSVFLSIFFPLSFSLSTSSDGCPNPDNNTHGFLLFKSLWNSVFFLILANWMDYEKFYINL